MFVLVGGLSVDDLGALIRKAYPDRTDIEVREVATAPGESLSEIQRTDSGSTAHADDDMSGERELVAEVSRLEAAVGEKQREVLALTEAAGKATISIQAFHSQQAKLFDDFVLLRSRYDEQKSTLQNVLWGRCASTHPDVRHIPVERSASECKETDDQVGKYALHEMLGEGQFATVRSCTLATGTEEAADAQPMAIKIIKKERIASFQGLRRISNEISILQRMHSKYVVALKDSIHTKNRLYIVTELGGADLFDFFDQHPEGVPQPWAKQILSRILSAVSYCHSQGVCHRDLKPENVLLDFDVESGTVLDIKLCDFGLSASFQSNKPLTEFCGSPGFFAPEMITQGSYFGDKSDCWSIGCIMLELILGHEQFCDVWMSAYDYDCMQDKVRFHDEMSVATLSLPDVLHFEDDCKEFIIQLLGLRGEDRPSCASMCAHPWLGDIGVSLIREDAVLQAAVDQQRANEQLVADLERGSSNGTGCSTLTGRPRSVPSLVIPSDTNFIIDSTVDSSPARAGANTPTTDPRVIRMASLSVETRARNLYHNKEGRSFHLPAIDPPTPVVGARKAYRKGSEDEQQLLLQVVKEDAGILMGAKPHHKKNSRRSRDGLDPPAAMMAGPSSAALVPPDRPERQGSETSGETDTARSSSEYAELLVSQSMNALEA